MERLRQDKEEAREGVAVMTEAEPRRLPRRPVYLAAIITVSVALVVNLSTPRDNILSQAKAVVQVISGPKKPDVLYIPTPPDVVEKMLALAEVKEGDVLYDLGCGDGRIVVAAAERYGIKAFGFDIDPKRIDEARANVREHHVEHLVTIKQEDIFKTDLNGASVITMYLLPNLNVRLMPKLAKLKPGTRIVSHAFDMKGAKPKTIEKIPKGDVGLKIIYLWEVPWEKE